MERPSIPFSTLKPLYERHKEEYDEAALRVLRSGWYIMGKELEAFETAFSAYIGSKDCIGVNSGLDALTLAVRALGIGPGDEVIVQANTYIATVLAITANGATPAFVEADAYHGIDPAEARKALTGKTKAIMAVHLYGQPCDMGPLLETSRESGIPIIEDCAQSHGASWEGKMTGSLGALACFSFYPTKNLGAFGDAGAVVTNDDKLADRVRVLRNYGSRVKYENEIEGVNSRLDEIQAALLAVRLRHLEEILVERESLARQYLSGIKNPLIRLPGIRPNVRHTWHQFVIESDSRDRLQGYLREKGIQTQVHYPVPPHLSRALERLGHQEGCFPAAERIARQALSLPLFSGMENDDIEYIIDTLNRYPG